MKNLILNRKSLLLIFVIFVMGPLGTELYAADCKAGDTLSPGQSCTYPGTNIRFSVNNDGSAQMSNPPAGLPFFLKFLFGARLNDSVNFDATINGKAYKFTAKELGNEIWGIEAVGRSRGQPVLPPTEPALPPDLIIQWIQLNKVILSPGERFTISATVRNRGEGHASSTTLRYYRSTNVNSSATYMEVGTDSVSALGANRTADESISLTAPTSPGMYSYGVCVDSVTNESNTDNNCSMTVTVFVGDDVGPPIEGPWLWMIAPTGNPGGKAAATLRRDYLSAASNGAVTEKQIATHGATAGDRVGDKVWTLGKIAPTEYNNIGQLVNALGLGRGDINHHVAYGLIALDSPREQKTQMYVGSDDAVKVWLNGTLVHNNPVDRFAFGYQESFPVTLKNGENILLVAIYERGGYWSGFFGFEKDLEYSMLPSQAIASSGPAPDLVFERVRAVPATVAPGEKFRLYATLKNQGTAASAATKVRYYRSTDRVISKQDTQLSSANRNPLAPNATLRRYLTTTAPTTPGTYYYGVCVDSITGESDTDNNCAAVVRVTVTAPPVVAEDVNEDGTVDVQDLVVVAQRYGQTGTTPADVNGDGVVNVDDLILVAGVLDADAASAPSLHSDALEGLTVADVKVWLSQARQRNMTDPSVRRGIQFLEGLLASMVPKETALLANYPNPFNPETWIPYQLSKPTEVTLTIYGIDGHIVRQLALGHQPAGDYQDRSRAAYWDGRNALGEPVASGVYFYTLTAGDFSATRKMLIRK